MVNKPDSSSSTHFDFNDKYGNQAVTTAEDLDKLISLAEDVSSNLHHMDAKASVIRQKSIWCVGIMYIFLGMTVVAFTALDMVSFSKLYELLIIGGILVSVIPVAILFYNMRRNLRRLQNDIQVEATVLQELLDMVHELENASRYRSMIDPVSSATFRMRLKRLHFAID